MAQTDAEIARLTLIVESERRDRERLQEDLEGLKDTVNRMSDTINELKLAILGNTVLKQEGLIGMQRRVEERVDALVATFDKNKSFAKGLLAIVTIIMAVAGVATAWDSLKKFLGN